MSVVPLPACRPALRCCWLAGCARQACCLLQGRPCGLPTRRCAVALDSTRLNYGVRLLQGRKRLRWDMCRRAEIPSTCRATGPGMPISRTALTAGPATAPARPATRQAPALARAGAPSTFGTWPTKPWVPTCWAWTTKMRTWRAHSPPRPQKRGATVRHKHAPCQCIWLIHTDFSDRLIARNCSPRLELWL